MRLLTGVFRQPMSPWREDGVARTRPPGRKGTRAGTDDAEGEGDHATSTGAVAHGSRLGWRRARKLAMTNRELARTIGQFHADCRRPRLDRVARVPASPRSSAMRVIRAATSRKIVSIVISSRHHLSSTHSRMSVVQIDNAWSLQSQPKYQVGRCQTRRMRSDHHRLGRFGWTRSRIRKE
jgi:hypothetical protein